jgi:hypothetical protein
MRNKRRRKDGIPFEFQLEEFFVGKLILEILKSIKNAIGVNI